MSKPSLTLLSILLLLAVLILLAGLQYRWLGQISEAERERLKASLNASAARFSEEFDREITRAFTGLQMDLKTFSAKSWNSYAERYERWRESVQHPGIVNAVYLIDIADTPDSNLYREEIRTSASPTNSQWDAGGAKAKLRISQFDPTQRTFIESRWPKELESLRQRLQTLYQNVHQGGKIAAPLAPNPHPISSDIPAMIAPVLPAPPGSRLELKSPRIVNIPVVFSYIVITIDVDYTRKDFLPFLGKRYLPTTEEFHFAIFSGDAGGSDNIIYQSDPLLSSAYFDQPDAESKLLNVRMNEPDLLLPLSIRESNAASSSDSSVKGAANDNKVFQQIAASEPRNIFTRNYIAEQDAKPWRLAIVHRAGSLERAVAFTRRRNLAISIGVLLLLATAGALIIFTTNRAERLAQHQKEFVAGVTHELRTPLTVICSAGGNLADGVIVSPERVRQYGELIKSEGRRLIDMVEQVLDFAGTDRLNTNFKRERVEIETIIDKALASCHRQIKEAGFAVIKEIADNTPFVYADEAGLVRAIINLITNAIKYSDGKRLLYIEARLVSGKQREVAITIADEGRGIPADELQHIFEPFRRGREAIAAQIHGNGLGLAIVKRIIEAHSGRVSVKSELGRGTSFYLHLPVIDASSNVNGNRV